MSYSRASAFICGHLIFAFATAVIAQTPTLEQSLNLKTAASPRISPDGRFVAYTVSETDWENDSFEAQIWMVMTSTGERYQLTHAKKSSTYPRWAPDSRRLGFISDRDGTRQIYIISPAGGEATQVTHFEGGVTDFEWAPGGHMIAFTSTGGRTTCTSSAPPSPICCSDRLPTCLTATSRTAKSTARCAAR